MHTHPSLYDPPYTQCVSYTEAGVPYLGPDDGSRTPICALDGLLGLGLGLRHQQPARKTHAIAFVHPFL
jgi:hypothetical protein